jgi:ribosomal protein L9
LKIEAKDSAITISSPIKALGAFTVQVDLSGVNADLAVEVGAEK